MTEYEEYERNCSSIREENIGSIRCAGSRRLKLIANVSIQI